MVVQLAGDDSPLKEQPRRDKLPGSRWGPQRCLWGVTLRPTKSSDLRVRCKSCGRGWLPMVSAHLHRGRCGSWACPRCAPRLGRALGARLETAEDTLTRLDEKFIMATLTLHRSWASAGAAFAYLRSSHAVRRAVQRWWRARGFEGMPHYLAKLELQGDGFPHFHVLIVVPRDLKIRLPWARNGCTPTGGEFDSYWPHGFSNVQRDGVRGSYAAKAALSAYACKAAAGESALETAGLPAKGVHFVQVSQGFWKHLGVSPVSAAACQEFPDEVALNDDGAVEVAGQASAVVGHAPRFDGLLVHRVEACGSWCVVRVEGGMRDESGEYTRDGAFTVYIPERRSLVAGAIVDVVPDENIVWGDDEMTWVEGFRDVSPAVASRLFEFLRDGLGWGSYSDDTDLSDEVRHRLGFDLPAPCSKGTE